MRKIRKIVLSLFLAAVLLLAFPVGALAHDVPDMTREGSITMQLICSDTEVSGGVFTLWRVGDIAEDDGNYSFVKTEAMEGYAGSLDNLGTSELAEDLGKYINEHSIEAAASVYNDNGTVVFSAVKPALYLIQQTKSSKNFQDVSAFLVSVPQNADGVYVYDVNATPKMAKLTPTKPTSPTTPTGNKLPQTGQVYTPIFVLTGLGVACLILGAAMRRTKRYGGTK